MVGPGGYNPKTGELDVIQADPLHEYSSKMEGYAIRRGGGDFSDKPSGVDMGTSSGLPATSPGSSIQGMEHVSELDPKYLENMQRGGRNSTGFGPADRLLGGDAKRRQQRENEENQRRGVNPGGGIRGEADHSSAVAMRNELSKPINVAMNVEPPSQAARRSVSRRTMRQNREDEMRDARTHHTSDIGFA
jgi:hypothetical protein